MLQPADTLSNFGKLTQGVLKRCCFAFSAIKARSGLPTTFRKHRTGKLCNSLGMPAELPKILTVLGACPSPSKHHWRPKAR